MDKIYRETQQKVLRAIINTLPENITKHIVKDRDLIENFTYVSLKAEGCVGINIYKEYKSLNRGLYYITKYLRELLSSRLNPNYNYSCIIEKESSLVNIRPGNILFEFSLRLEPIYWNNDWDKKILD